MAASAVMSAQAGCQMLSTSFRKESTPSGGGGGELLDSSSQPHFCGSPRSMAGLRRTAAPRQSSPSSRPVSASCFSFSSMIPGNFMADADHDDAKKDKDEDDEEEDILSSSNEFLETINNVMADVVDGQKYLKETGRTRPRPMKRRSLMVCLAMGAIQPYLSEVEDRITSLRRTTSNSLAKTVRLVSQLSFGASRQLSFGKSEMEQLTAAPA